MRETKEEASFLQRIELVNFMCHDNLLIEFTKKVTCIVGDNGSGKSAIMIALGVVFGVRAAAMRGTSYRQYIKTGEDYAVIRVSVIKKEREGVHKHLTIEKRISAESSKIKITEEDTIIGRSQDDLNVLIETLRINLKNPVCFLTQDKSKKILKNHNTKGIYSFFKSATDIENIETIHEKDSVLISTMKQSMETASVRKLHKKTMLEGVQNRLEMRKAILTAEEAIKRLKLEKEWAKVTEQERKRSEAERERESILNKFSEYSHEKEKVLAEIESVSAKIAEISEKRKRSLMKRQDQQEQLQEEVARNEKKHTEILKELEYYNYEVEKKAKKTQMIEQVLGRPQDAREAESTQEELLERKRLAEEECTASDKKQTSLEVHKAHVEIKINSLRSEMHGLERTQTKKEEILHSYKFNNPMKFYGISMERAIAEIKERRIEATGPIGLNIRVKDTKWSRAIETALGSSVFGFIVHTHQAKESVEEVLIRCGVSRYQIYLTKRQSERQHDRILDKAKGLSKRICESVRTVTNSHFTTVLAQIEDNDTLIVEQLIILQGIEKIGLVERRHEGYAILQRHVPLDYILTPAPDRIQYVGTSLSDMRCAVREKQLLVSKEGESILMKEIEEINQKRKDLTKKVKELIEESETVQCALRTNSDITAKAKEALDKIEIKIKAKKDVMKDDLEIEYMNSKNDLEHTEQQRDSVRETYKEASALLSKSQKAYAEVLAQYRHTQEDEDHAYRRSIKQCTQEDAQKREKMEEIRIMIESLHNKIDRIDKHLEDCYKECLITKDTALHLSNQEVIIVSKTVDEINSEIVELEAKASAYTANSTAYTDTVNSLEPSILSDRTEETEETYLERKRSELEQEIERIDEILKKNLEEIEEIEKGTAERIKKREELKYKMAEEGAKSFTSLMEMRDYAGTLEFDHMKEELNINVKVCDESKGNKQTLSGGERSFSGICFLLSLWPHINSPLRILDEFDVFMDGLNRKAALNLIFETARALPSQIIIITPLGVSDPPTDICKVFTLKPPIRN